MGTLSEARRYALLEPLIRPSASVAAKEGASLALIRPRNTRFRWRRKPQHVLDAEKAAYEAAGRQKSLLDAELAAFNPSPCEFAFVFEDGDAPHTWRCGDWETHATFFNWRRLYGEDEALRRLGALFNEEYPKKGMVFAIGNMAKRPQTWQLLGVIRLDEKGQLGLL